MLEQEIRQALIKEAREWRGTPWIHHQKAKGFGTDCLGFILGVADAIGIHYDPIANYNRIPAGDGMLVEFQRQFYQVESRDRQPGDVGLIRFSGIPHHCVIFSDRGIIHASLSERAVVEHGCDGYWQDRLVAVFNPLKTPTGESTLKLQ